MLHKSKRIAVILSILTLLAFTMGGCTKKQENLTTVTLNEVAHSIFYAPQ